MFVHLFNLTLMQHSKALFPAIYIQFHYLFGSSISARGSADFPMFTILLQFTDITLRSFAISHGVLHESFGEDVKNGACRKELCDLILGNSLSSSWSESMVVEFIGSTLLLVVNISFEIF